MLEIAGPHLREHSWPRTSKSTKRTHIGLREYLQQVVRSMRRKRKRTKECWVECRSDVIGVTTSWPWDRGKFNFGVPLWTSIFLRSNDLGTPKAKTSCDASRLVLWTARTRPDDPPPQVQLGSYPPPLSPKRKNPSFSDRMAARRPDQNDVHKFIPV